MKHQRLVAAATAGLAAILGGCAMTAAPVAPGGAVTANAGADSNRSARWRSIATPRDEERLRGWWQAWTDALASARARGHQAEITAAGVLLEPMAAQPNPHIPPGDYACRVIKLGAREAGNLAFVAYPQFRCRIAAEQEIFSFTKLNGSQRPVGLLFDDSDQRQIFLGTLMLGDERQALDYGADPQRDMAGLLERIGPRRWRLVLPRPAYESLLDVIELVPLD